VLGEDSGLAVDALDGAPGVYSARFSGDAASDESNNALLLKKLGQTPLERRTAHYVCHLALADAAGNVVAESEARCNGRIRFQPAGTAGFGYDPLFEIVEYHRTFAELGETVKRALSHRARAVQLLLPQLLRLIVR
jgi:XTP/dITP diphosphohydrolase